MMLRRTLDQLLLLKIVKKESLTVIHVNAHSLLRHYDDVAAPVVTERPHILALLETWLNASVTEAETHLAGYSLYRSEQSHYGGFAIYCFDNLPCSFLSCDITSSGV